jgi:hypothetical protein
MSEQDHRHGPRKVFVIAKRCGRLANRLTISAHFMAYAEEYGHRVVNVAFHSYAHLFPATRDDLWCRYPARAGRGWWPGRPAVAAVVRRCRLGLHAARLAAVFQDRTGLLGASVKTIHETKGADLTPLEDAGMAAQLAGVRVVFVNGWNFRASRLVERHAEKIRAYFRPVEAVETRARALVDRLRQEADIVFGIHVRHGDYRRWLGGKYYYPVEQYAAWMREIAGGWPGPRVAFLVCSDEPRRAAEFPGLNVGFGAGEPVTDLYALARCDYLLGAPSTFSAWASFQGGKPLFQPADRTAPLVPAQFQVNWL